jgi:hypothetical protein
VTKRAPPGQQQQVESHNYASLPGAWAYREIALRRSNTKKVEIVFVLDESTPDHPI